MDENTSLICVHYVIHVLTCMVLTGKTESTNLKLIIKKNQKQTNKNWHGLGILSPKGFIWEKERVAI